MHLRVKDITFSNPADNLRFDNVLLALAVDGTAPAGFIRFWEAGAPFIVLGRRGQADRELRQEPVRANGIPVLRRTSGGGTVVQGKGCLNYALVLPKALDPHLDQVEGSYRWISARLIETLREHGVNAVFQPVSDLAVGQRKFSGNAQRRTRAFVLHHGTLLYDFDLKLIERLLAMPPSVPPYRQGRGHLEFVTNVSLDPEHFKISLADRFGGGGAECHLTAQESAKLAELRQMPDIAVALE